MSGLGYPTCPACGRPPGRHRLFCTVCWADVPAHLRDAIDKPWKATRVQPGSKMRRAEYDNAIADAAAAVYRWTCPLRTTPGGRTARAVNALARHPELTAAFAVGELLDLWVRWSA